MLQTKRGVVFGASSKYSLGFYVAKAWIAAQAEHVVLACETDALAHKLRAEATREGWWHDGRCSTMKCNVNVDEDVAGVFEQASAIDMVLHSVAFAPRQALQSPLVQLSREDFLRTMETSAYSLVTIAKHARFPADRGGSITSLTFHAGTRYVPGYGPMAPAKASLETLSLYLAHELGGQEKKIRCNCISPGPINTPAARAIPAFHDLTALAKQRTALKRTCTATEVAQTAVFLASDLASGITGQVLRVDAGDV